MTLELGQREKGRNKQGRGERGEGWSGGGPGLGTRDTHLPTRLADWQTTQPPFLGSFLGEIRDKERDRATLLATFNTF